MKTHKCNHTLVWRIYANFRMTSTAPLVAMRSAMGDADNLRWSCWKWSPWEPI